jgi:membrane-associated phospholipid phosphatase
LAAIATVAAIASWAARASADGARPDFAFGEPAGEAGLASFAVAANLTYFLPQHAGAWEPSSGPAVDRTAEAWSNLVGGVGGSLVALGTGYVLESTYLAIEGADQPGIQAFHTTGVEAEAVVLSTAITSLVKRLVGRCRPRAYSSSGCGEHDAFPSGHTSAISAFAGARIVGLAQTPMDAGFGVRAASLGLAEATTVATAILRVVAGAHNWEDVVVGAAVGHATGALVAIAHPSVRVDEAAGTDVATRGRSFYFETGFSF